MSLIVQSGNYLSGESLRLMSGNRLISLTQSNLLVSSPLNA